MDGCCHSDVHVCYIVSMGGEKQMVRYENRCVGCETCMIGCKNKSVRVLVCDECGCEVEKLYVADADELCEDCYISHMLEVAETIEGDD